MTASPPDLPDVARPWFRLARLLPSRLRERVFEPAYYDLLALDRRRPGRVPLGMRVCGLVLETCRVGWPDLLSLLWRTPLVRWALVAMVCGLALSVLVFTAYRY